MCSYHKRSFHVLSTFSIRFFLSSFVIYKSSVISYRLQVFPVHLHLLFSFILQNFYFCSGHIDSHFSLQFMGFVFYVGNAFHTNTIKMENNSFRKKYQKNGKQFFQKKMFFSLWQVLILLSGNKPRWITLILKSKCILFSYKN